MMNNVFSLYECLMLVFFCLAVPLGTIEVNPMLDLEQVRKLINKLQEEYNSNNAENELQANLSTDWCFIDCEYFYI